MIIRVINLTLILVNKVLDFYFFHIASKRVSCNTTVSLQQWKYNKNENLVNENR